MKTPRLDRIDLTARIPDKETYEKRLKTLQLELLTVQQANWRQRRRAIVLFEGWDTAGKGSIIRRISERLDPRQCLVWPIGRPSEEEQGRHYLYRFWEKLPQPGTIAIFDRSWYGRVLVERVEGLIGKPDWKRAYREINEFERMLVDDGIRLIKLFLHITPEEQLERLVERLETPYKRWKLTADDLRNRAHWNDYEEALDDMFRETSTRRAPWHALGANYKWHARIRAFEVIIDGISKGMDLEQPAADRKIATAIRAMVRKSERRGRSALTP